MRRRTFPLLIPLLCVILTALPPAAEAACKHKRKSKPASSEEGLLVNYQKRAEVLVFIDEMVEKHGFV
jgi:hypothetical protein